MSVFEETIEVAVDPGTAYSKWADVEELPTFIHDLEKVKRVDEVHAKWFGRRGKWETRLTENAPERRLGWIVLGGGSVMVDFDPIEDGTRISLYVEDEGKKGHLWSSDQEARQDLERFKEVVEGAAS